MAGDWIKMRCNLDTDPAVFKMAELLGIDELGIVGRLWKFWAWADQHVSDCNAVSVTTKTIDRITCTKNFSDALQKVGWLELKNDEEGYFSIPNFDRHNGQTAKRRALTKNRVEKNRVTHEALQKRYNSVTREEKRRCTINNANALFSPEGSAEPPAKVKPVTTKRLADDEFIERMKKLFPKIDVDAELRKMDAWLLTRPQRQKTQRFISTWLSKVDAPIETKTETKYSW
jgi:hypothetical protein